VNIALSEEAEAAIERLIESGKYHTAPEVVQAAVKKLEESDFVPSRPAGYFADDYGVDTERVALESAMSQTAIGPER
jgi:hypothetical protein